MLVRIAFLMLRFQFTPKKGTIFKNGKFSGDKNSVLESLAFETICEFEWPLTKLHKRFTYTKHDTRLDSLEVLLKFPKGFEFDPKLDRFSRIATVNFSFELRNTTDEPELLKKNFAFLSGKVSSGSSKNQKPVYLIRSS